MLHTSKPSTLISKSFLVNCKIMCHCNSTGETPGRRGSRCFNLHHHSKMSNYQFKKKSSDLNSYLFHTEWPLPSAFPHAGSTAHTGHFQGLYIHQHDLFYKFKLKRVLESQVKTGRCSFWEREGAANQLPSSILGVSDSTERTWEPLPAISLCPGMCCLQFAQCYPC